MPVAGRHLHLLKDHNVIIALQKMLYLIHSWLEQGGSCPHWDIEMDLALLPDGKLRDSGLLSRGRQDASNQKNQNYCQCGSYFSHGVHCFLLYLL
jgi:hypothetical protein